MMKNKGTHVQYRNRFISVLLKLGLIVVTY